MKGFNKKGILKTLGFLLTLTILSIILIGCSLTNNSSSDNTQNGSLDLQSMDSTTQDLAIPDSTTTDSTTPLEQGKKLSMDLYFPDKGNEAVLMEKHEVTVFSGAVLKAAVEGLLAGPDSESLMKPLPEGTKLLGINLKGDLAIVDFSKEFTGENDVDDVFEQISLVNTLTEFTGINKVKILIEGYDWTAPSGEPYGEMTKILVDTQGKPIQG